MQIPATINQLIHSIYHGVLEKEPWSDFLNQINQLFNADLAVLVVAPKRQAGNNYLLNRVVNNQADSSGTANHWIALDPFQHISDDQATLLDELDHANAIEELPFYQALIKPTGMRYIMAINIPAQSSADLLLKLRIARDTSKPDFSQDEIDTLNSLVTHIKLALDFLDQRAIKQIERNAFADAINQFMLGTLILDRKGKIVASNRVARDAIEHNPQIKISDGTLVLTDNKANEQLYQALADISSGHHSQKPIPTTITTNMIQGQAGVQSLGLMVRPVRPEDALAHPVHAHAVVFISDVQGTPEVSTDTLQQLFGFTNSEARVAAYLANGHTIPETAEALSISINTAKTHSRNIYEKTGVNKQTKFIQLISNSVARVS
ncbi:helix-turn-helix transcriptional regulator [Oceanicoccus sp. KOV_DT_Chl]|uniref:helix-turn-helix transcriptional regulator n=1 Tax=Oceanicoccus sp. KOV_DT_Chl TaxID=1904639 RepID=UPI00135B85FB|nr:LuxR C-terminal-related transcriptional regulator [Oceanicoccus sp. KOV_DT_Chl]